MGHDEYSAIKRQIEEVPWEEFFEIKKSDNTYDIFNKRTNKRVKLGKFSDIKNAISNIKHIHYKNERIIFDKALESVLLKD